jgi:hypothetical protein
MIATRRKKSDYARRSYLHAKEKEKMVGTS